ncbi:unnamed protein product [Didymodactylos carnosus]|uniref:SHSP domain-containing protein n=1 Tax=Didymodactylos carnosus TaxID=1234261 RepID=A0A813ULA9_9BILA|nr:unnamed protein product [Didymodactylos carnosus]CAF3611989.1 unnamed protein product [Didymodactylos carnosus]
MNNSAVQPGSECTRIEVVVSEFSKGEISVKLRRDNTILVHALHLDQYAADNFFRKELVKTFQIPAGADIDKIRSIIRQTGVLTIDIPMLRDQDAIRRSREQLLDTFNPKPTKQSTGTDQKWSLNNAYSYNRSASQGHVEDVSTLTNKNNRDDYPTKIIRKSESAIDVGDSHYETNNAHVQTDLNSNTYDRHISQQQNPYEDTTPFNIADFLQSKFSPTFTPNGKKLILKLNTRGYDAQDLSVKLFDNTLLVQGRKSNEKDISNNNTMYDAQKSFTQSIRLPNGVDTRRVASRVTQDNYLLIEVPLTRRM